MLKVESNPNQTYSKRVVPFSDELSDEKWKYVSVEGRTYKKTIGLQSSDEHYNLKLFVEPAKLPCLRSEYYCELASYIIGTALSVSLSKKAMYWEGKKEDVPSWIHKLLEDGYYDFNSDLRQDYGS